MAGRKRLRRDRDERNGGIASAEEMGCATFCAQTRLALAKCCSMQRNGGAREIIVGVGGSVTNDGGFGMARALGFRFFTGEREIENGGPPS